MSLVRDWAIAGDTASKREGKEEMWQGDKKKTEAS